MGGSRLATRCDHDGLDVENLGDLLQGSGVVADAQGEVVRRALGDPAFQEGAHVGLEEAAGVGVARRRDRAVDALALGDDELELARRRSRRCSAS